MPPGERLDRKRRRRPGAEADPRRLNASRSAPSAPRSLRVPRRSGVRRGLIQSPIMAAGNDAGHRGREVCVGFDLLQGAALSLRHQQDDESQCEHAQDRVDQESAGAAEGGDHIEKGRGDEQVEAPVGDRRKAHRSPTQR